MNTEFSTLALRPELLDNLQSLGYQEMTEIQAACLPLALEGRDVIAQAKTGSGKTAAFGLTLLQRLDVKRFRVQTLVLCPTRELADQVAKELRRLARQVHNIKILSLCGGVSIGPQIGSLEHGAHIIVGTPGRIQDHLRKQTLDLSEVNTLVFDEADRMLDMGFSESIAAIVEYCPTKRQTLLFSATYPKEIEAISSQYLNKPEHITVTSRHQSKNIQQLALRLSSAEQKDDACHQVLATYQAESCIIFCATKRQTTSIAQDLKHRGWTALALNGDMEQRDRDQTLLRFANGSATILVATDVAARGLDIESVGLVINYDLPRDPEIYVHRIGRTGRAGREGIAVCLVEPRQQRAVADIEEFLAQTITDLPEDELSQEQNIEQAPKMVTIAIDGGKKSKVRAGDILGSLTRDGGFQGSQIGKISITPFHSYIAIHRAIANQVLNYLREGKIKGRVFKVRKLK